MTNLLWVYFNTFATLITLLMWVLVLAAAVVALVRSRKVSIVLQIVGAILMALGLFVFVLVFHLWRSVFTSGSPISLQMVNLIQTSIRMAGLGLFVVGYCMEKFVKPRNQFQSGFPVSNAGLAPQPPVLVR